jgi:hypothetical protein
VLPSPFILVILRRGQFFFKKTLTWLVTVLNVEEPLDF